MSPKPHIDLVLRYGSKIIGPDEAIGTHQAIAFDEGAVWFGKLGSPIGPNSVARLTGQIERSDETHLFVVTRVGNDLIAHYGVIRAITNNVADVDTAQVPEYYDMLGITSEIGTWVQVENFSRLNDSRLRKLTSQTTKRPIYGSLLSGRRSSFFVG